MTFISYDDKPRGGGTIAEMYDDVRPRKIDNPNPLQLHVWTQFEQRGAEVPDVAFQLPTGQGKTLAGLGIAEWLRRTRERRVVYVCPTRQLAHQVRRQGEEDYGFSISAFVGSRDDYDESAYRDWMRGEIIAVTTYSTIFSAGDAFANANVLVLDDAHAAEQYVASMWTLRVTRSEHEALFRVLSAIIKPAIPGPDAERLTSDAQGFWDQTWVEQVPMDRFAPLHAELTEALDEHAEPVGLHWAWRLLKGHLDACHLYVGSHQILIRPLLPPTKSHAKFSAPQQRIYMSATLGEGGELERIFGRERISRLEPQEQPPRQVVGRRFFMFPAVAEDEEARLLAALMRRAGRTLVLVSSEAEAAKARELIETHVGFRVFGARDIELSKSTFLSHDQAVAVIANRYDGIDFPRDECRLTILFDMPTATTLQERFLIDKLGCLVLYNDRIRTRLVQAVSRCTRSNSDYAAVVVVGTKLADYLVPREGREFLHPELQGEIRFGVDNSARKNAEAFVAFLDAFLDQADPAKSGDWKRANDAIIKKRDESMMKQLPARDTLAATAPLEVEYVQAIWRRDYSKALERCRTIVGNLNAPELRGYQALWNYLAGSAALLAADAAPALAGEVETFYRRARAGAITAWPPPRQSEPTGLQHDPWHDRNIAVLERFEQRLSALGLGNDVKFEPIVRRILHGLTGGPPEFEAAQVELGQLLGYDAGKLAIEGGPDPYWRVDNSLVIVFEDHSDGIAGGTISIGKARQTSGHERTIRKHFDLTPGAEVITVLVTPAKDADEEALQHLEWTFYLGLDEYRQFAYRALETVRTIRATTSSNISLEGKQRTLEMLLAEGLAPEPLAGFLKRQPAAQALR